MKKIIVILIVLLSVFSSCGDIYTPYYLNIENQTTDTIKIVFLEKSPYSEINQDYLIFPSKLKKMLYGSEGRALKDGCSYTGIKEGEVEVYTFSGKKLRKEIWNINNWNCNGNYKHGWEMTFIITEGDLE